MLLLPSGQITITFDRLSSFLGLITTNALNAADTILIPIQCSITRWRVSHSLMNTVRRIKRQYNERLDIEGVLLTMYDGRLNLTQQVVEEVKKYFSLQGI